MHVEIHRGDAPLIVSLPHTGTDIPADLEVRLVSPWLARKDTDWWVHRLYDFAAELGATTIRAPTSRTVIDVNRDPSGASLYPGQATTGLCPTETFDGEPLYAPGQAPDATEIADRRRHFFEPFHEAIAAEVERLRARYEQVVLYDAHSIRSHVPRMFEGQLPNFNIGANGASSCAPALVAAVERACDGYRAYSRVTDGRFRGGWTTRHYGRPKDGVHAIQMELACRGYMDEPVVAAEGAWPTPYDPIRAAVMRGALTDILQACLAFAESR